MAIAFDAQSTKYVDSGTGMTWNHTCTGANRILLVGIFRASASRISAITYAGEAMTNLVTIDTNSVYLSVWYIVNPASGTNAISVTFNGTYTYVIGGGVSYTGVNQADPVGTPVGTQASANNISHNIASAANQVVVDFVGVGASPTLGAGQTIRMQSSRYAGYCYASDAPGAAPNVAMSWTVGSVVWIDSGGVSIKPASAGNPWNYYAQQQ